MFPEVGSPHAEVNWSPTRNWEEVLLESDRGMALLAVAEPIPRLTSILQSYSNRLKRREMPP